MHINSSRRGFIRGVAGLAALGACGCLSRKPHYKGGKIRLAAVGIWGKGFSDWMPMVLSGKAEIVALCDCDRNTLKNVAEATHDGADFGQDLAKIPFYTDYRRLLDDAGVLGIDAMTVSTTDHTHAPIAIAAMKMGIHVYVQMPLVRTLWELDYFGKTAKDYNVVTQMGNQGSSLQGFRRGVEVLNSGILGDVREVHVWTNRPVWPQGRMAAEATFGEADAVPDTLDWDAWLSTAKNRPFKGQYPNGKKGYDPWGLCNNVYHPFSWRGFF
ncbi:MAG: Gfo/Idh/MocA family oxidoreductase, partial [Kiritimatiellae bacterium]|nr:Gfo/Idh/MocA family oxidoreductase [Kiritimatiellia bacterium]